MTAPIRTSLNLVVIAVALAGVQYGSTATASPAMAGPKAGCFPACKASVGTGEGSVKVTVVKRASDKVPGRGERGASGAAPGRLTWTTVEEYATPACTGNGVGGQDNMCAAALNCPAGDHVRYWVWHRETAWAAGPPVTSVVGQWQQEPGSYCLGPEDPGVTPIGAVIAAVQTGFQNLPLPRFETQIRPTPTTLVNVPTSFAAGSAAPVTLTTEPLAGIVVTVVATPVEWFWTFGDGTTTITTIPGRPGTDDVTHVYQRAQSYGASVRVTWTGTFSLPGSPEVFPIRTPAYVQGPVTPVDVRQARTELVRGD